MSQTAGADDGKITITPHIEAAATTTDSELKAGAQAAIGTAADQCLFRLLGDTPFSGDKSQHEVQLDAQTNTWKLEAMISYAHVLGDYTVGVSADGSIGRAPFTYYPVGGAKEVVGRNSYTATFETILDHAVFKSFAHGIAPQLRADFTRTWTAADSVAVLGDSTPPPETIPVEIVSPPAQSSTLGVRGSVIWTYDGTPWGVGLSARYLEVGAKGDPTPFAGFTRLRLEAWGYYFFSGKPTNTRLGFAPFVDFHVSETSMGLDRGESIALGVLAQLRVGTILREY